MATDIGKGSFRGFGVPSNKPSGAASATITMDSIDESLPQDQVITRNLQTISDLVTRMNLLTEKIDTPQDSEVVRNDLENVQSSITKHVKETSNVLKTYCREPPEDEKEKREWKIQTRRLKELFHDTLSKYQDLQKVARVKQRTSLRQSMNASGLRHVDINPEGELIEDGHQLQIQTVKAEVDLDLIKEREAALKQLEKDIVDIHDIFKELAVLVEEQGEDIDVIEKNVEQAKEDVEDGVKDLEQALDYTAASRRKYLFIGLICLGIVAVIVVIIVLATQT